MCVEIALHEMRSQYIAINSKSNSYHCVVFSDIQVRPNCLHKKTTDCINLHVQKKKVTKNM